MALGQTCWSTKRISFKTIDKIETFLNDNNISYTTDLKNQTIEFDLTELNKNNQDKILKILGEPLKENKMKKLTKEEKIKVKNFAKKLVEKKETDYYNINPQIQKKAYKELKIVLSKTLNDWYSKAITINNKFKNAFPTTFLDDVEEAMNEFTDKIDSILK